MIRRATLLAAWTAFLAGCSSQPLPCSNGPPNAPPPSASRSTPAAAPALARAPVLSIDLALAPPPQEVRVRVRATGARAALRTWSNPDQLAARGLELTDELGRIGFERVDDPSSGSSIRLARPARGAVSARYSLSQESARTTYFRANGRALLLLPAAYAKTPVSTRITLDVSAVGDGARAASSLGLGGEIAMELSADALFRSAFVGGKLGRAFFDGPEGLDRAAWLGSIAFDPRQTAAEVAGFRSAARDYFASRELRPFTLLMLGDARASGEFAAERRTGGVLVEIGAAQQWTGALRLATAQQVLREWIGSELALEPVDRDNPLEPAWLVDGLNRSVARELLFRFGLLTPEEYRDEIEQLLALHLTSPLLGAPLAELGKERDRAAAERAIVARGALFATLIDARVRQRSAGAYGLDDLLRELFTAARARKAPLPAKAFGSALANLLDVKTADELEARYLRGTEPIILPSDALGRCFGARPRSYVRYALGFRLERAGAEHAARDVDPKGPAHRAGLRDGERIRDLRHEPGRTDVHVRLSVERAGRWIPLSYAPVAGSVKGQGFVRMPGVKDEHCTLHRAR